MAGWRTWGIVLNVLISAETAYLFRHAVIRDAAYDLLPPTTRATLHGAALAIMEELARELPQQVADSWCGELADHARNAVDPNTPGHEDYQQRELDYLRRAAAYESRNWQNVRAVSLRERIWNHSLADDLVRFDALYEATETLVRSGRPNEAPALAEQAIEIAQRIGSADHRNRAWAAKAQAMAILGRHEEAEELNRTALKAAAESGEPHLQARILITVASVAQSRGQWERSEEAARQAWELLRSTGDQQSAARTQLFIGDSCWQQGRLGDAADYFRQALETYCITGHLGGEATARDHLGSVLRESGRLEEGRQEHERSAAIYSDIGDALGYGSAITNLATALTSEGRLHEARRYRVLADGLFRSAGALHLEGVGLGNLGSLERRLGLLESASQRFQRARDLFLQSGHLVEKAVFDAMFGQLLLLLGFQDAAATNARQASEDLTRLGTPHWRAQYVAPLEVRLAVERMLHGSAEAERAAEDALIVIRRTAESAGATAGSMLAESVRLSEALLAEARKPEPLIYHGHLVSELEPAVRLALLDRGRKIEPPDRQQWIARPWLLDAMQSGTEGVAVPDWESGTGGS
ncbi:MAG: tetratricopeptide repeat protein [Planctomycetes bacterium]|nr:tetratricopeptide repeat protein [Planctomycetota bacterium]